MIECNAVSMASSRSTWSRMSIDTQSTQRSFATQTEYDSETENEMPEQILTKATDIVTETKNNEHHDSGPFSPEFEGCSMYIYAKQENEGFNMTEDYNVQGETAVQENFDSAIEMVNDELNCHEIVSNEDSSYSLAEGSVNKSIKIEPFEEPNEGSSNSLVVGSVNKSIKIEPFEEPNEGSSDSLVEDSVNKSIKIEPFEEPNEGSSDSLVEDSVNKSIKIELLEEPNEDSSNSLVESSVNKSIKIELLEEPNEDSSNSLVESSVNKSIKIELLEEPNEDSSNSLVENSVNKSIKVEPLEEPSSDQYCSEKFLSSKTQRHTKATGNTAEKLNKKRKKRKKMPGGTAARRFDRDRKRKERLLKRLMVNPGQDEDSVIQVENHKRPPWFTKYFTSSMSIIKK